MDILALAFLGGLPSYHWGAFPIDNEGKYQQYLDIPCKGKTIEKGDTQMLLLLKAFGFGAVVGALIIVYYTVLKR